MDTWRDARRTTAADAIYEGFVENMRDAGLDGIVNVIRKPTAEAAEDFENESVDFVFIDGDRTWEALEADLEAWWPKVKAGGVLLCHDYTSREDFAAELAIGRSLASPPEVSSGDFPIWKFVKSRRLQADGDRLPPKRRYALLDRDGTITVDHG